MTCPNCKPGEQCADCQLSGMGYVKKTQVEDMIKQIHAEPGRVDTADRHAVGDIDALFAHAASCPDPLNCKITKKINEIANTAYLAGLQANS